MKFVKEKVSPKKAMELLERNNENRRLRLNTVNRYAADMKKGRWHADTGETIKITNNGDILDGQHRLHAVIKSNTTQEFWFAYDVKREVFPHIDTGLKRTGGDVLYSYGIKNSNSIAGVIRKYLLLKNGYYSEIGGAQAQTVTNEMILNEYDKHSNYWQDMHEQIIEWYGEFYKALYPSDIGGFYAWFSDIDQDDALKFFEKLSRGTDLSKNSPIKLLRDKILKAQQEQGRIRAMERAWLISKAWNYFTPAICPNYVT
jgi:hypothetical protein